MGARIWISGLASTGLILGLATPVFAMDGIGHNGGGSGSGPTPSDKGLYASIRSALVDDSRLLRDAILGRGHDAAQEGRGAWVVGQGAARRFGDAAANGLRGSQSGAVAGFDAPLGRWRVGAAAGVGGADYKAAGAAGAIGWDSWQGALWTRGSLGGLRLTGGLGYARHAVDSHRTETSDGAAYRGAFAATTSQAFAEAAYPLNLGRLSVEPYADAAWVRLESKGFTETGGASPLTVARATQSLGYADLGLRLGLELPGGIRPYFGGAWRRGWGDLAPACAFTSPASPSGPIGAAHAEAVGSGPGADPNASAVSITGGAPLPRDSGAVRTGFDVALSRWGRVGLAYDGVFGKGLRDQSLSLRLAARF